MSPLSRQAGYAFLTARFGFDQKVIPNWHTSFVSTGNLRHTRESGDAVMDTYPASYWPGDTVTAHLEFALKYDGTNVAILAAVFDHLAPDELLAYVRAKPLGKFSRRLWFFYEWLTGTLLQITPLSRGTYIPLLEPDEHYTGIGRRSRRHRLTVNVLAPTRSGFCPFVRKTPKLEQYEAAELQARAKRVLSSCPPDVLRRAMHYLYTKETKSSFAIEKEQPSPDRTARFVNLLHDAEVDSFVTEPMLVRLQNQIVHSDYKETGFRNFQNYVGQTISYNREWIHYIGPRPVDVKTLMGGLMDADIWMSTHRVSPVVHAAVISFGFVFIHPFDDGNGRIHRFLIHNVLSRRKFAPPGSIFPVSAVMLNDLSAYNASLEAFSQRLMPLVDYTIDAEGCAKVVNDTKRLYQFMDLTAQAEALFGFVESTIDTELVTEIN